MDLEREEHLGLDAAGQIQGDVETGVETGRDFGKIAMIAGAVVAVGVIYLLGRRHGRKKRTIVEIKRV